MQGDKYRVQLMKDQVCGAASVGICGEEALERGNPVVCSVLGGLAEGSKLRVQLMKDQGVWE